PDVQADSPPAVEDSAETAAEAAERDVEKGASKLAADAETSPAESSDGDSPRPPADANEAGGPAPHAPAGTREELHARRAELWEAFIRATRDKDQVGLLGAYEKLVIVDRQLLRIDNAA